MSTIKPYLYGPIKTYTYRGPIQLGSVMAHHCGAAGLFPQKTGGDVLLEAQLMQHTSDVSHSDQAVGGHHEEGALILSLSVHGHIVTSFTGVNTPEGRRLLGKQVLIYLRTYQGLSPYSEWGTMVGVRPTKPVHTAMSQGLSLEASLAQLVETHHVSPEKVAIVSDIVKRQENYVAHTEGDDRHISVYGGIPFCQSRCTYCSFPYGLVQDYNRIDGFVDAWLKDMAHVQSLIKQYGLQVDSLYMGGGTPTALDDGSFSRLVAALGSLYAGDFGEFTVEAGRPDSLNSAKLEALQEAGANRISINPQTMQDEVLRLIGRNHSAQDIVDLYTRVRRESHLMVNMDFIAGLPGQNLAMMEENMDYVCRALPENVTIHTLALKRGSPLYDGVGRDLLPDQAVVSHMVDYSRQRLEEAGYVPYYLYRQQYMTGALENIGYCLPGYECAYNIHMMEERQCILSVGPGSSSKWMRYPDYRQKKQHMPKDVDVYIETIDSLLDKRSRISGEFWEVV